MSSNRIKRYKDAITVKIPNRRVTVVKGKDAYYIEWRTACQPDNALPTALCEKRLGTDLTAIRLSQEGVDALIYALTEAQNL
jgi:hypothetical protein